MKIGVITRREKSHQTGSVMHETIRLLQSRGIAVEMIYTEDGCLKIASVNTDCDLYLLKSGNQMALSLAGILHTCGAKLLNSYQCSVAIRDKIISTRMLLDAGIPTPETHIAADASQLAGLLNEGPLVVKPYWAASQGRGVRIINRVDELESVTSDQGLVFAQRFHQPDAAMGGRDEKLYVIDDQVFGVRRVWPPRTLEDKIGEPFVVGSKLRELALQCGRVFGAELFGVDVLTSGGKPYVVDINTFPGYKGVPRAGELIADHILRFVK
jgi:ribosomal protein S6--L-glutamate ligase